MNKIRKGDTVIINAGKDKGKTGEILEINKKLPDFSPSEIEEFSSRWLIARLLSTKKSYREIASETGVSTTTIGRVARFIKYGNNGYKMILERTK